MALITGSPFGYFDPLQLSKGKTEAEMNQLREYELKHGRVAMAAVFGLIVEPYIHPLAGTPAQGRLAGTPDDALLVSLVLFPLDPAFWHGVLPAPYLEVLQLRPLHYLPRPIMFLAMQAFLKTVEANNGPKLNNGPITKWAQAQ